MQEKEGMFLTTGVFIHDENQSNPLEELPNGFGSFGYKSGLITTHPDLIKCNIDPIGDNNYMEKTHYTGKGGIFGQQTSITTPISYRNLEKEIPGFKFSNGPCNPCKAFNTPSDYSCKFKLNIDNDNKTSSAWKHLWN
jgi:hypothetical protein